MRPRSFRSILDECLAALQQGESVEACLARYPRHSARLKPLLSLAQRVRRTPPAQPRPWAQATAWNAVRLRAADLRAGKRRAASLQIGFGWLKPVAAVLALFFALGAMGGATAFASQDALPNDTLYPVKLFTEDVHVWVTFDETQKAEVLLDQSDERIEEINALVSRGRPIPENVLSTLQNRNARAIDILEDRPEETELWGRALTQAREQEHLLLNLWDLVEDDARVEYTEVVADVHNLQLGGPDAAVAVVQPEDLSGGIRTISGTVDAAEGGVWTVGGVQIRVDERTINRNGITPGATVSFVVSRGLGGRLYALSANLIQTGGPPSPAVVYGQVEEVTDNAVRMNGQWYRITPESLLKTPLRIGQTISVTVENTEAGAQVASAEAVAGQGGSAPFIFEGIIDKDAAGRSDEWTVGGLIFTETPTTQFDLTGGAAVDGARALVEAVSEGGNLLAQKITILNAGGGDGKSYLIGEFEGARPDVWEVSGLPIEPRPNLQAPAKGSLIALDTQVDDGVLTATKSTVIRTPDAPALSRQTGTVIDIENTTWSTQTDTFRVASRTSTVSGKPLEGARAIIWYRPASDGMLDAVYVRVLDENPVLQPPEPTPPAESGQ